MAVKFKHLLGLDIKAADATLGSVKDVYFDDQTWKVRYFVVDTSNWLMGKKVLISPDAINGMLTNSTEHLPVNLTKKQIKDSPGLAEESPVSRQFEIDLHTYYGWAPYWGLTGPMVFPYPDASFHQTKSSYTMAHADWGNLEKSRQDHFDGHLRSLREITGYKISTKDDKEFGQVSDVIIEGNELLVIDLILNSNRWLPGGKEFVCSPMFVENIDTHHSILHIAQSKEALISGPEFNFDTYGEDYRKALVGHYCKNDHINAHQKSPSKSSNHEARM